MSEQSRHAIIRSYIPFMTSMTRNMSLIDMTPGEADQAPESAWKHGDLDRGQYKDCAFWAYWQSGILRKQQSLNYFKNLKFPLYFVIEKTF